MSGGRPQEHRESEKAKLPREVTEREATGPKTSESVAADAPLPPLAPQAARPIERGGPAGLEPTRYGDWERAGRCIDF